MPSQDKHASVCAVMPQIQKKKTGQVPKRTMIIFCFCNGRIKHEQQAVGVLMNGIVKFF